MEKQTSRTHLIEPAGIVAAGLRYVPGYLAAEQAAQLFDWLCRSMTWHSEQIRLFGRRMPVPRQVAWCGDPGCCYRYSNLDHRADGWPPVLLELKQRISAELQATPNFLLLNRYRSGQDAMGWHADDEPMASDLIGSISLGAARRFLIRPAGRKTSIALVLEHGSLLVHPRRLQHSLPRTQKPIGERINLSFRVLA